MQVILLEKVNNLGVLGDVVNVKDGYARNYLLPKGKAQRATKEALELFEKRRAELEAKYQESVNMAKSLQEKLNDFTLQFQVKASVEGKLFGSITNQDVSNKLKDEGFTIHKSDILLNNNHIKTIGEYEVQIKLHTDITATVKLVIVSE